MGEAHGTIGDEDSVHRGTYLSVYDRSKHEGEQAAFAAAHRTGVEVVAICPSSVQGPGRASGNGKLILDYVNGKLPAFVDTYVSVVDIADCTEAHLLAAERGRAGARYVLNGATITSAEALDADRPRSRACATRCGSSRRRSRARPPRCSRRRYKVRGRVPSLCRARIRTLLHGHRYDGSLADARARARLHAGGGDVPAHDRVGGGGRADRVVAAGERQRRLGREGFGRAARSRLDPLSAGQGDTRGRRAVRTRSLPSRR